MHSLLDSYVSKVRPLKPLKAQVWPYGITKRAALTLLEVALE